MEPLSLLNAVREVSHAALPACAQQVSQRAFDAAAKQDDRYANLPPARDIARRLKHSWREVLVAAHLPGKERAIWLSGRRGSNDQHRITPEHIAYVLKLAARRSQRDTLSAAQYDVEREKILAEHKARHPNSKRLRLPTADQICAATQSELYNPKGAGTPKTKTWDRALELAELPITKRSSRKLPGQPVHPRKLIERYYEEKREMPTPTRLWRFADENGLPYTRINSRKVWTEVINDWKRQRAVRDLPAPQPPSTTTHGENALAAMRVHRPPTKHTQSRWRSREKCVAVVAKYLAQLPAGTHGTAKSYDAWAQEHGDAAPRTATLKRHGGWLKVSELAREKLMSKK